MKIAFKQNVYWTGARILVLGAAAIILCPTLVHAESKRELPPNAPTQAQPAAHSGTTKSASPYAAASAPSLVPMAAPSVPALSAPVVTAAALPIPATPGEVRAVGTLRSAESDVPEAVKSVIKRLDSSADDITVEDLNGARQAIAKVEVLIELEKKLSDLQKARNEREGRSNLVGAIPASALGGAGAAGMQGQMNYPMDALPSSIDIIRIVGGSGNYHAITKSFDGSPRTLDVGDKMADGSVISSISATGVTLDNKGEKHVVRIKNVDKVFSGTP